MRNAASNYIDLGSLDDRDHQRPSSTIEHIPGIGYAGSSPQAVPAAARHGRLGSGHNPNLPAQGTRFPARSPIVVDLTNDRENYHHPRPAQSNSFRPTGNDTLHRFYPPSHPSLNVFEEMTGGALGAPASKNSPSSGSPSLEQRTQRAPGIFNRKSSKQYSSRSTSSPLPPNSNSDAVNGASIPMPAYASRSANSSPKVSSLRINGSVDNARRNGSVKSLLNPSRQLHGVEATTPSPEVTTPKVNKKQLEAKARHSPQRSPVVDIDLTPKENSPRKSAETTPQRSSWQRTVLRSPTETSLEASPARKVKPPNPPPAKAELTAVAFRRVLQEFIKEVRSEHDYFVRTRIRRARKLGESTFTSIEEMNIDRGNVPRLRKQWKHTDSPFTSIQPLKPGPRVAAATPGTINLGHYFIKQGKASEQISSYDRTEYEDDSLAVPPYTNYISTRRNILIEDDKHRTSIPYLGEEPQLDRDYLSIEQKISRNAENYEKLNFFAERASQYVPYIDEILSRLGTDVDSVLNYLLNGREPSRVSLVMKTLKHTRDDHLIDGYYSQSDDSDSAKSQSGKKKRAQRQYRKAQKRIGKIYTQDKIDRAALACDEFMESAGFSIWHVVKYAAQAAAERETSPKSLSTPNKNSAVPDPYSLSTYVDLGCLICKGHECPGHGEYEDDKEVKNLRIRVNHREYAKPRGVLFDSSSKQLLHARYAETLDELLGLNEDGTVSGLPRRQISSNNDDVFPDSELCSDDCFWSKANRTKLDQPLTFEWSKDEIRALETLRPAYDDSRRGPCLVFKTGLIDKTCREIFLYMFRHAPDDYIAQTSYKLQNMLESARTGPLTRVPLDYWLDFEETYLHHRREPFIPCNHAGPCSEKSDCECFKLGITCEKSCACADDCGRKFRGCQCHARNRACFNNDNCECSRLNRECDPDLCRSCGAHEVLDPVNRHNREIVHNRCANVYIQRGVPKRTLLGHSKMMADGGRSGWGLYMGEPCKKGDYVGEYVGEVVSSNEADQRGIIYDKRNLSYLFDVNQLQTLDSTLVGNKLRFINHQTKGVANVEPHTTFCNTVQRMGMFACKDVAVGEELFFDYGENFASKFNLIKLNHNAAPTIEKGKRDLPVKYTKSSPRVTLSKNGNRIGRPPKLDSVDKADTHKPSSQSGPSSNKQAARQNRKRRFSTMDGAGTNGDAGDAEEDSEKEDRSETQSSPAEEASIVDDDDDENENEDEEENNDNDGSESSSSSSGDDEPDARTAKVLSGRGGTVLTKRQRKRRSDFGVKKGPRNKPPEKKQAGSKAPRTARKGNFPASRS